MSVSRFVQVSVSRPIDYVHVPDENIVCRNIILTVDLDTRVVSAPELGDLDLDSVIRLADTLRMALDARRTGLLEAPVYMPESDAVLYWLYRYMHKMIEKSKCFTVKQKGEG